MRTPLRTVAVVAVATVALLAAGAVFGLRKPAPALSPSTVPVAATDRLAANITRAQERLRKLPRDHETWAALGLAYVEQARVTADPSLYPRAEGALERSLAVKPKENPAALVGLGALANARHEFAAARKFATDALKTNPFDADAYGVLADAHTQLGDPAAATTAIQRMLDLRPGLAAYARASYDLEQRGELAEATELMRRALDAAADPADIAFCRNQLGDLAWSTGDLSGASREYAAGLAASPGYLSLLRGKARVAAAQGDLTGAVNAAGTVAARTPTPDTLLEYATLLKLAGRLPEAARQLTLAEAAHKLFVANGGQDDLTGAQLALARGDAGAAVRLAQAEWRRRPFADVADVLGWSLHLAGRDREALPLLRRAVDGSPRNAGYAYHLGMTLLFLGDQPGALSALRQVRAINPYFSPADGPTASRALSALEARP
ncbi:Tetratricopeptide repeat-containing protein [Asanoa hainanensis]|uniref:Tetratricopeptide repeat-containing protein n=1 Tax=Asanoa hainanensis TaxID=560556 RepID=A0A239PED6_9ACTN|nr:tetratricopeptide repeat protein [Asanoa hainanensis]SNT65417.1 Tetratricopeptide repeat-containing protein [Asanoa hainanensis]